MVSENYACAYKEVIEVLKYTKREDVDKIPQCKIVLWKQNMKKDYNFKIDPKKTLEEQNLSKEAKAIIANIFKKYWATDYQKQRILEKERYDMQIEEEKKSLKYNTNDLFKNRNNNTNISNINENENTTTLIEYKEPFISKIINKIKQLLKKF